MKAKLGLPRQVRQSESEWYHIIRLTQGRPETTEVYKAFVCATLYIIWKERNKRRIKVKMTTPSYLATKKLRKVSLYLLTLITEATNTIHIRILCANLKVNPKWKSLAQQTYTWQKPNPREFILNTDGSVTTNNHGCAGLNTK